MLAIVLSFVFWQATAPPVTLTIPAARVPVALNAIAKQTGQPLAADVVISKEVVAIRVAATPIDQLLTHLAEAVGGEWRTVNGTKTLVASLAATKRDEQERTASRTKAYAAGIAKWPSTKNPGKPLDEATVRTIADRIRYLADHPPADGNYGPSPIPNDEDPKTALLHTLIRLVPLSTYVNLAPGVRVVFSESPTSMQEPLPVGSEDAIAQFRADQKLFDEILMPAIAEIAKKVDPDGDYGLPKSLQKVSGIFKVDFAVSYEEGMPLPTWTLDLVDPSGKIVGQASEDAADPAVDDSADGPEKPTPSTAPDMVGIGQEDLDFGTFLAIGARQKPGATARLTKWKPRLLDPVQDDPLIGEGRLLVNAAETLKTNLVADLDDALFIPTSFFPPKATSIPASKIEDQLQAGIRFVRTPGWLVGRPLDYAERWHARVDRQAAKRMFARVAAEDGLSVDAATDYAAATDSDTPLERWDSTYAGALETAAGRNGIRSVPALMDGPGLRLYGTFTPDQKAKLRNGGLRFNELNADTQHLLAKELFWGSAEWDAEGPAIEPTDVFPNGIPPRSTLRVTESPSELVVVPVSATGQEVLALNLPINAQRIGAWYGGARGAQMAATYRQFRLAQKHEFTLTAEYAPGISRAWTYTEMFYTPDPITNYEDLPQDFRAAADAAKKKTQDQLRDNRPPAEKKPPP